MTDPNPTPSELATFPLTAVMEAGKTAGTVIEALDQNEA